MIRRLNCSSDNRWGLKLPDSFSLRYDVTPVFQATNPEPVRRSFVLNPFLTVDVVSLNAILESVRNLASTIGKWPIGDHREQGTTALPATHQGSFSQFRPGFFDSAKTGFWFERAHAGPSRTQVDFGGSTQDVTPTAAVPARPAPARVR
jgi:hypothetical protein